MNLKKSIVSLLSISALSFSIGGIASAQEAGQTKQPTLIQNHINSATEEAPFKALKRSITLDVGKTYPIDDTASYAVVVRGSQYVEVSGREIKGIKDSGSNTAEVWMYKSNGALLGALEITVRK